MNLHDNNVHVELEFLPDPSWFAEEQLTKDDLK